MSKYIMMLYPCRIERAIIRQACEIVKERGDLISRGWND
jgi:hypothetical protein